MTTTDKYINPFTDFGFKKIFGEEANKDLLIDFLNAVLKDEKVKDLTYMRSERLGAAVTDRKAIFDLYCENENGEKFIVEMQKAKQKYFKDRSVFYSTFPIQQQAQKGDWNFELKSVYTIGVLDFIFDETKDSKDYFHWEVKMMDVNKKEVFYDKLTYIYFEMPKFNKTIDELENQFDKWMYLLKNLPQLLNYPFTLQNKLFEKLFKVAEIARFTPKQKIAYEDSLKVYRDLKNVIDTAFEEGKIEGKIEERTLVAKIMKEAGEPIEKIIAFTGLTNEEIENLNEKD